MERERIQTLWTNLEADLLEFLEAVYRAREPLPVKSSELTQRFGKRAVAHGGMQAALKRLEGEGKLRRFLGVFRRPVATYLVPMEAWEALKPTERLRRLEAWGVLRPSVERAAEAEAPVEAEEPSAIEEALSRPILRDFLKNRGAQEPHTDQEIDSELSYAVPTGEFAEVGECEDPTD